MIITNKVGKDGAAPYGTILPLKFEYLWQNNHADDDNVSENERLRRHKSIEDIWSLIPENSFFTNYLLTYLPTTNCSPMLLLGSGLAVASMIMGRKVWCINGSRIYPNLWVGLIAKSGEKKSTANNLAKNLLYELLYDDKILPSYTTEAAFFDELSVSAEKIWHIDEMGGWIKKMEQNYNSGFKELLTELYDCPDKRVKKLAEKQFTMLNAFLTICGSSSIEWFNNTMKETDLYGGFLGRWSLFFGQGVDYQLPFRDTKDLVYYSDLEQCAEQLKQLNGEMTIEPSALKLYQNAYKSFPTEYNLFSWNNRIGDMLFKLALLFNQDGVITSYSMEKSIALLRKLYADLDNFIRTTFTVNDYDREQKKIMDIIRNKVDKDGAVMVRTVQQNAHMDKFNLTKHLITLEAGGSIEFNQKARPQVVKLVL